MTYTGGLLNELNGKMGISAPYKSVPVMKLIKAHQPKSREELAGLIKSHYEKTCECGIKSRGTVEMFGKNLYDSQMKYWGKIKFSLQECIQWEYDLFIVQSLKGGIMEKKAMEELFKNLVQYKVGEAGDYVDEELRIDIIVMKDNSEIAGIQVKPNTFKWMRNEVISFNRAANKKWGKPVFYLYYNDNEEFLNLAEVESEIKTL